jgi:hypothetical protein
MTITNVKQMEKISKEYDAELAWEKTIQAQSPEVKEKIMKNRAEALEKRRKQ